MNIADDTIYNQSIRYLESHYNAEHDVDPGLAPVRYNEIQLLEMIKILRKEIKLLQHQIDEITCIVQAE